jgi:hypothetical protein
MGGLLFGGLGGVAKTTGGGLGSNLLGTDAAVS